MKRTHENSEYLKNSKIASHERTPEPNIPEKNRSHSPNPNSNVKKSSSPALRPIPGGLTLDALVSASAVHAQNEANGFAGGQSLAQVSGAPSTTTSTSGTSGTNVGTASTSVGTSASTNAPTPSIIPTPSATPSATTPTRTASTSHQNSPAPLPVPISLHGSGLGSISPLPTTSETLTHTVSFPPTATSTATSTSPPAPCLPNPPKHPHVESDNVLNEDITKDKEVYQLLKREGQRQAEWLNLIASENYASKAVMQAEGSIMMNKYSEGYPGMRHYGGNDVIDAMEQLCQDRALSLYSLDSSKWGVNVQSLAGTQANSQVYHALMKPHERLMGLSLTHGGHMSFGYQTDKLKVSCVSAYYDTLPYEVDLSSGRIDYDDLEKLAKRFRPKVIVAGASSYCRLINYYRLKSICSVVGAYLVVDMAHIAGQIAAKLLPSPFDYADVVTTATQKTLRGPRGALIFFKKELEGPINFSVFPASQGGPHNHTITAMAVALGQANTRDFKEYQRRIMSNAKALETALIKHGFSLVSGGTDIHMVVVSLVDKGIDGARVNAACERSNIALSATAVPGDTWALPRAVRIGTTAMTTRGFTEEDFVRVVDLLSRVIEVSVQVQSALPETANKLRDFKAAICARPEFDHIKRYVKEWVASMPPP